MVCDRLNVVRSSLEGRSTGMAVVVSDFFVREPVPLVLVLALADAFRVALRVPVVLVTLVPAPEIDVFVLENLFTRLESVTAGTRRFAVEVRVLSAGVAVEDGGVWRAADEGGCNSFSAAALTGDCVADRGGGDGSTSLGCVEAVTAAVAAAKSGVGVALRAAAFPSCGSPNGSGVGGSGDGRAVDTRVLKAVSSSSSSVAAGSRNSCCCSSLAPPPPSLADDGDAWRSAP